MLKKGKMACRRKEMGISNLVVQCGSLASILENSLGVHGKAVLMEKSGNVIITQDGTELLNSLAINDPVLNIVTRGIVDQVRVFGDGCKTSFLLLRRLLDSLDGHVALSPGVPLSMRRQKMIQKIIHVRKNILPYIEDDVIKYGAHVLPLRSFEALGEILLNTSQSFFSTKFSKLISKTLAQLLLTYILSQCSSTGELIKLLDDLANNAHIAVVEVYKLPLLKSQVVPGFFITRDFKYLEKNMQLENVPFVLWSIALEEKKDEGQSKAIIETANDHVLMRSIFIQNRLVDSWLASLHGLGVKMIFSSVYFPDWAVSVCRKYRLSLIDMIDEKEWNFVMIKTGLTPIVIQNDINSGSIRIFEKVEPVAHGLSRFVNLHGLNMHQIVLCGPTITQCHQFSTAFLNLFKYLHCWMSDCLKQLSPYIESKQDNYPFKYDFLCNRDLGYLTKSVSQVTAKSSSSHVMPLHQCETLFQVHRGESIQRNLSVELDLVIRPQGVIPVLFSVPHGSYMHLLARYLVENDVSVKIDDKIVKAILMEVLDEIPWLLHRKARLTRERYIQFQMRFNYNLKNVIEKGQVPAMSYMMDEFTFTGHQNPFMFFKILDSVLHFAEYILRIECIVPAHGRISSQEGNCESDESDND
ncbi:uncharacterized protein LOC125043609 [Penaeus chinensis]|uniref:uncharacterized protein LOC125043609 n=1 Tax=Penaeus chinensis TaxID=139456 RepID=UPI001FB608EA|nr:uncharacterized protein LOC125043609 [Penaeus chinensis]